MSKRSALGGIGWGVACALLAPWSNGLAWGQESAEQPEAAGDVEVLEARVIDVRGAVKKAPAGVAPTDPGWTAVQLDEMLSGGTQIKTGFRSSVVLEFGPDTVVQIRKASLASIDDYYKTATEKTVLLGLGYGTVRGGSTEAELRTDVTVDSTVATLAKRGTEGWQMSVEPTTGRFRISLARSGLVDAILKATGDRRRLRPNEYATDRNVKLLWINQDIFDRFVSLFDAASMSDTEVKFAALNAGGRSVVSPDAAQSGALSQRSGAASQRAGFEPGEEITSPSRIRVRPEGDFGIPPTPTPSGKYRLPSTGRIGVQSRRATSRP